MTFPQQVAQKLKEKITYQRIADMLGINRVTLYDKLKRDSLTDEERRKIKKVLGMKNN